MATDDAPGIVNSDDDVGGRASFRALSKASGGFGEYLDPSADSLFAKVRFVQLFRDLGRGTLLALVSMLSAALLAIRGAAGDIVNPIFDTIYGVYTELLVVPAQTQSSATDAAAAQLDIFGLFALPVSTAIILTTLIAVLIVLAIFWGWTG